MRQDAATSSVPQGRVGKSPRSAHDPVIEYPANADEARELFGARVKRTVGGKVVVCCQRCGQASAVKEVRAEPLMLWDEAFIGYEPVCFGCLSPEERPGARSECAVCGKPLIDKRSDADCCSPSCRAEASRVRRLLAGEEVDGYRTLDEYLQRRQRRTETARRP